MSETWRAIPGFDRYEVSDAGRVRHVRKGVIVRGHPHGRGYWAHTVRDNAGVDREKLLHHLVLAAFVGPRPDGLVTRHLDGDPSNNRLGNLAYGTYSENGIDSVRHGTNLKAARDRCDNGHAYTPENTAYSTGAGRVCRSCAREFNRRFREKNMALGLTSRGKPRIRARRAAS